MDHCNDSPSLTCILYTSVLNTYTHFSQSSHIFTITNTFTLYYLAWKFKKPFIISFITLHFIQPKINELFIVLLSEKWKDSL